MHRSEQCLTLEPGITVLDVDRRHPGAFYRLAVAELARRHGTAYWIDARNAASTYALYEAAPNDRLLEPLRIARAFTAHQHHALVRELLHAVDGATGLILAPNVASLYRDDDLHDWERDRLFGSAVETLAALATNFEVPVLLTAADAGPLADTCHEHATARLSCDATRFGYRFEGEGVATDGYWDGDAWQTTIPYWVDLLGAVEENPVDPVAAAADRDVLAVDDRRVEG